MTFWYLIPKTSRLKEAEIGSYEEVGGITNFPKGIFIVYADKGLVVGLESKKEAERWRDEGMYDEQLGVWTTVPKRLA